MIEPKAYSILKAQELELLAEATERCEGMGKGDQFSPSMPKYNNSFQFLSLTITSPSIIQTSVYHFFGVSLVALVPEFFLF